MALDGDALAEAARALVERTCAAQGLPFKISDPALLHKIASLLVSAGSGKTLDPAEAGPSRLHLIRRHAATAGPT